MSSTEHTEHPKRATVNEIAINSEYDDIILLDGLDDAILGMVERGSRPVVAYSVQKILDTLVEDSDMTYEDAQEYYGFNIECLYAGEGTPVFVDDLMF